MMLAWVAAGLALAAVVLGARWWRHPYDVLGQRRAVPLAALLSLELAALALVPVLRLVTEEHRLSAVATELVGSSATVQCQPLSHAMVDATGDLGHVRVVDGVLERKTLIKNEQCRLLARYQREDEADPTLDEVVAVHVLTHESMHMRGVFDEAAAECAAVQRDATTARLLGATDAQARELAVRYWLTVYPLMPDAYRSTECGPGGAMDEHLATAPWAGG